MVYNNILSGARHSLETLLGSVGNLQYGPVAILLQCSQRTHCVRGTLIGVQRVWYRDTITGGPHAAYVDRSNYQHPQG